MYENLGNNKIKEIHITKDTLETQMPEIKYKKSEKKNIEKTKYNINKKSREK